MRIVFFGTPQIAADVLTFLIEKGVEVVAVVTRQDKPQGRSKSLVPPPVKATVLEKYPHIPILQPERASSLESIGQLQKIAADLFVVVAFGQLLKQNLLDLPRLGCINLHASLLPKYRGAAPMQRCLMDGVAETGVTIMQMTLALDAGAMLRKVVIPVPKEMNLGILEQELCRIGRLALFEVIEEYELGILKPILQNELEVTYAPKIEATELKIDWSKPAFQVHNLVRAVSPSPGAWCLINVKGELKRLKVLSTSVIKENVLSGKPGTLFTHSSDKWAVCCKEMAVQLHTLQLEGKKVMSASEFFRGYSMGQLSFV